MTGGLLAIGGLPDQAVGYYNLVVTVLSAIGLIYLLYSGHYVVNYRRFFKIIAFGLLISLGGSSFFYFLLDSTRHLVHGTAALVIAIGLFDLVRAEVPGRNVDWTVVLRTDPPEMGAMEDFDPEDEE